jgi:hypothetical protein
MRASPEAIGSIVALGIRDGDRAPLFYRLLTLRGGTGLLVTYLLLVALVYGVLILERR